MFIVIYIICNGEKLSLLLINVGTIWCMFILVLCVIMLLLHSLLNDKDWGM